MSLFRSAVIARSLAANVRRYSTTTPSKPSSNLGPWLTLVGTAGIGISAYLFMREDAKPKQEKSPLDPENFVNFKLKKVEPYNHNTAKFTFELPDGQASLLPVASCLVVRSSDPEALKDAKGKPIVRPYTPISPSDKEGELVLIVKKYDTGNASKHIHSLKPGDSLSMKGPFPKWDYKINEFHEVGLIGGGSGITPLYQVLNYALSDKTNKTKFKLLFSNVTEADILLREEIDVLKKKYPDTFDVVYILDKADDKWKGPTGYINADIIKQHIAPASLNEKVKIFVCGPPGQVEAVAGKKAGMKQGEVGGVLKELGYTADQIYKF